MLFSENPREKWDITGAQPENNVHKNCTFFELFWTKVLKIEEIQPFSAKSWQIMGHIQVGGWIHLCKKLHFFSTFFEEIDENRRNSTFFLKIRPKNGTYTGAAQKIICTKIALFFEKFGKK